MDFDSEVARHDAETAAAGLSIWVGGEPTFTDRFSQAAEWLGAALGEDKRRRAEELARLLQQRLGGGMILRSVGRQYPGEDRPRFSLGIYRRRDGSACWCGPPDPLELEPRPEQLTPPAELAQRLRARLAEELRAAGASVTCFEVDGAQPHRLAFRPQGDAGADEPVEDEALLERPPLHLRPLPLAGLTDRLAERGSLLVTFGEADPVLDPAGSGSLAVELPHFSDIEFYFQFLGWLGRAAVAEGLATLILAGYPPPVSALVEHTTLTPDPGVLEVNMAPAANVAEYLWRLRTVFEAAESVGLSPLRYRYDGTVTDSGGGGHLTFGGPAPEESPFFRAPHLLPALLGYLSQHPSLSYLFANDSVGGASQAPRPDEGLAESFRELALAVRLLSRRERPTPFELWSALSPFLVDSAGNTHRAEVNVEKLWNPYLPGRGQLGVVEFRALRMAPTPERAAAVATLLRSVCVLLGRNAAWPELRDYGPELHDRFALPFFLAQDLEEVLGELDEAGLGLGAPVVEALAEEEDREVGRASWEGCELVVRQAVEFWPLVGDAASQERGTSRWVDSSTVRQELVLRPLSGEAADLEGRRLVVDGVRLPLRLERDRRGPALVLGLRYRTFDPSPGLHPLLRAHGPVTLHGLKAGDPQALSITLHPWRPAGGGYPGLPEDDVAARARREERFVVGRGPATQTLWDAPLPPAEAPYCLDLRWLQAGL
ncbi:MAG: transglutaminase family protein [Deltaproteobacteria bacterium]|nr:transglutaminase family protein [Deltaproteobacteria bacterium]